MMSSREEELEQAMLNAKEYVSKTKVLLDLFKLKNEWRYSRYSKNKLKKLDEYVRDNHEEILKAQECLNDSVENWNYDILGIIQKQIEERKKKEEERMRNKKIKEEARIIMLATKLNALIRRKNEKESEKLVYSQFDRIKLNHLGRRFFVYLLILKEVELSERNTIVKIGKTKNLYSRIMSILSYSLSGKYDLIDVKIISFQEESEAKKCEELCLAKCFDYRIEDFKSKKNKIMKEYFINNGGFWSTLKNTLVDNKYDEEWRLTDL